MFPCCVHIVSALVSHTVVVIFIWQGPFLAVPTRAVLGWLIAYTVLFSLVKDEFYVTSGKDVLHDVR